jgi:hypothetical protein
MPAPTPGFIAQTEGAVALAAAGTAKTVLNVIGAAGKVLVVTEFGISLDGVTAAEKPILVELCRSTQASAGTSTAVTFRQVRGNPSFTISATAAKNYTAEPTVLTPVREYLIDPYKGSLVFPFPLGREIESLIAGGIAIRCTIPTGGAAVNIRAYMEIEE